VQINRAEELIDLFRERERERERERQRETDRETETDRQRDRETETERETEKKSMFYGIRRFMTSAMKPNHYREKWRNWLR
jgi:thioesterase domain-containing protein